MMSMPIEKRLPRRSGRSRLIGFRNNFSDHFHGPQLLKAFNEQAGFLYILYGPSVDVRTYQMNDKGIQAIHDETDDELVDSDMLEQKNAAIGLDHTPKLLQASDGVRHGAEHESRDSHVNEFSGNGRD
jgi:hypothetical protein